MCINPLNKEIKVKPCLSRLTLLKHFTAQFWTKTGRFDKNDLLSLVALGMIEN